MSDREVMQQALEALDKLYLPGELNRVNAAIAALRARLAQPQTCKPALQAAEPVAWRVMLDDDVQFVYDERMLPLIDESIHATRQPLYTAPPARRPLTDEEIDTMWRTPAVRGATSQKYWFIAGIRAAEHTYKIGGNDD